MPLRGAHGAPLVCTARRDAVVARPARRRAREIERRHRHVWGRNPSTRVAALSRMQRTVRSTNERDGTGGPGAAGQQTSEAVRVNA